MTAHRSNTLAALAVIAVIASAGPHTAFAQGSVEQQQQSLYARLGGLAPISVVVSDFIDVLVPDPILNQNPAIDAARGGPCVYHGRGMKESHAHLNITEREWDRMVVLFKGVLAKHKVPAQEARELLEIVGSTKADIVSVHHPA